MQSFRKVSVMYGRRELSEIRFYGQERQQLLQLGSPSVSRELLVLTESVGTVWWT